MRWRGAGGEEAWQAAPNQERQNYGKGATHTYSLLKQVSVHQNEAYYTEDVKT